MKTLRNLILAISLLSTAVTSFAQDISGTISPNKVGSKGEKLTIASQVEAMAQEVGVAKLESAKVFSGSIKRLPKKEYRFEARITRKGVLITKLTPAVTEATPTTPVIVNPPAVPALVQPEPPVLSATADKELVKTGEITTQNVPPKEVQKEIERTITVTEQPVKVTTVAPTAPPFPANLKEAKNALPPLEKAGSVNPEKTLLGGSEPPPTEMEVDAMLSAPVEKVEAPVVPEVEVAPAPVVRKKEYPVKVKTSPASPLTLAELKMLDLQFKAQAVRFSLGAFPFPNKTAPEPGSIYEDLGSTSRISNTQLRVNAAKAGSTDGVEVDLPELAVNLGFLSGFSVMSLALVGFVRGNKIPKQIPSRVSHLLTEAYMTQQTTDTGLEVEGVKPEAKPKIPTGQEEDQSRIVPDVVLVRESGDEKTPPPAKTSITLKQTPALPSSMASQIPIVPRKVEDLKPKGEGDEDHPKPKLKPLTRRGVMHSVSMRYVDSLRQKKAFAKAF